MKRVIRTLAGLLLTGGVATGCQADSPTQPDRTLEGRLSVMIIDDFEAGTASRVFRLKEAGTGEPVLLDVPDRIESARDWNSGTRVRVDGMYVPGEDGSDTRRFRVESMKPLTD